MQPEIFPLKKNPGITSRRGFISACAACGACMAMAPVTFLSNTKYSGTEKKLRIRIIYSLHELKQSKPDWPNVGFDFSPFIEKTNSTLKNQFPSFEFLPVLATGPEQTEKIMLLDEKEKIDGYIVYQLNCWNQVVQTVAKSGKPVLYADFQFGGSGGFLVYNSRFLGENSRNVGFVIMHQLKFKIIFIQFPYLQLTGFPGQSKNFLSSSDKYCLAAFTFISTPRPGLSHTSMSPPFTIGVGSPSTISYHQSGLATGYSNAM